MQKKLLVKKEMGDGGIIIKEDSNDANIVDDPLFLKKETIRRMIVDESGENCFLIGDKVIFYNHWESETIFKIALSDEAQFKDTCDPELTFTSVEILELGDRVFEMLIGTSKG